jgi:hypothetical protein
VVRRCYNNIYISLISWKPIILDLIKMSYPPPIWEINKYRLRPLGFFIFWNFCWKRNLLISVIWNFEHCWYLGYEKLFFGLKAKYKDSNLVFISLSAFIVNNLVNVYITMCVSLIFSWKTWVNCLKCCNIY